MRGAPGVGEGEIRPVCLARSQSQI
jgi:hypothetical protein